MINEIIFFQKISCLQYKCQLVGTMITMSDGIGGARL